MGERFVQAYRFPDPTGHECDPYQVTGFANMCPACVDRLQPFERRLIEVAQRLREEAAHRERLRNER